MSWNYRVMRRIYPSPPAALPEEEYGIYEVYYDKDGNVNGYTQEPRGICASEAEDIPDMIRRISEALKKPILDWDNGGKEIDKTSSGNADEVS